MKFRTVSVLFASAAACALLPRAAAAADQSATAQSASAQPGTALGEIIVTAEKHEETLQRAPAAISVVSSDSLKVQGVTDIRAIEFTVPGIRLNKQQSVAQTYIRGVGIGSDALSLDTAVAMLVNGVVQPREDTGTSLFDVNRVEVLKGPEGTIYGSDAAGGVINVVLNRPTHDLSGSGTFEYGNYDRAYLTIDQNLPLGDQAQMRVAIDRLSRAGFASNGLDDQDSLAGRISVSATLAPNLDVLLWGSAYHNGGKGDIGYASPFVNPSDPWEQTWNPKVAVAYSPAELDHHRSVNLDEGGAEVKWNLGAVDLTYIPGYLYTQQQGHLLIDTGRARVLQEVRTTRHQLTQEFRLSNSDKNSKLQWLAGVYYYKLDSAEWRSTAANLNYNIPHQPNESIAVYGQGTYSVTDRFRLTAGLRYLHNDKSAIGDRYSPAPLYTPIPFSAQAAWDHADWKVGAEYDVSPTSLLYGSISTGYLGGGINFVNSSATVSDIVKPESLTAYQVGSKNTFLDGRLRLNAEAFYYDYRDYQVGLLNVSAATSVIFNAPKSEIYGAEGDFQFLITPSDRLTVEASYTHAVFTDFDIPIGVSSAVRAYDFTGFDLPETPRFSETATFAHTFDLSSGATILASAQSQFSTSYWTTFSHGITRCANVPAAVLAQAACVDNSLRQGNYTTTNLDLAWNSPDKHYTVALWVRNLENSSILASGGDGGLSASGALTSLAAVVLNPPRTFGFRLSAKW